MAESPVNDAAEFFRQTAKETQSKIAIFYRNYLDFFSAEK